MTASSATSWGGVRLSLAVAASLLALLLLPQVVEPSAAVDELPTETAAKELATATTTTVEPILQPAPTTSTSVPPQEALIPMSVEGILDSVAPSVGFVLSQQGTGSGVVISEDYLVTNAHVVWPDATVSLVFLNGATFRGRVLAIDPFVDLAVVDISRLTRKPAPISVGTTAELAANDDLWVVGYPAPLEFTPEPTIDSGELLGVADWEFTGVRWLTIEAPAIGGQSGGAVVDRYGRLMGISTFGSTATLTSISVDDVVSQVDALLASSEVRGLEQRFLPHSGARRSNQLALEGEWDQQLFLGWFLGNADVNVEWTGDDLDLSATTIDGVEIVAAAGEIDFVPGFAFPVLVVADAAQATEGTLESSLPIISYPDPDHGQTLPAQGSLAGIFDVGGDRDFFYLDLDEGDVAAIDVESAARTTLRVYGPGGTIVAEDIDRSGFIGSNASVEMVAAATGRHVVSIESSLSSVSGYTVVTR
ncbi:MAG: trypsin-like peptidase domain-containing protein [bacterium]|nr:trypsin-like peptidase domain-containing protein [bacterium]MCP4967660.1 trypsin-like peptidase domain-containing protein [bacterium]